MARLSRLEIKNLRRKQTIISRYLASLVLTSVAVVASFKLFYPIEASINQIEAYGNTLYIETDVKPNEDLVYGSLILILESTTSYQEQPLSVGTNTAYFDNLYYGRRYSIKIKGDLGFGIQTLDTKTYTLSKKPYVDLAVYQSDNIIYYYGSGYDVGQLITNNLVYLDIYENDTLIKTETIVLDPQTRTFNIQGDLLDIIRDDTTYKFEFKYDLRGGKLDFKTILYETKLEPMITGEVYGMTDGLSYFLYIEDFNQMLTSTEVKIEIIGNDYHLIRAYQIDLEPYINDQITGLELGYYEVRLFLEIDYKQVQFKTYYVQTGEETWLN